jgi:hypothetical protein
VVDQAAIDARNAQSEITLDRSLPLVTSVEDTGVPLNGHKTETEAEAFKRMIQERIQDEEELEAAVPASGVSSVINSRANSRAPSPAPSTPRRDLFSGVSSMKEMFDISYTVHRLAEEKQIKKNLRANPGENRRSVFMNAINGDSSSDDDDMIDETSSSSQTTTHEEVEDHSHAVVEMEHLEEKMNVASITPKRGARNKVFELNMDKSTLLGRRKVLQE